MINSVGNHMTREIARQARLAQDVAQTQIQLSTGKRVQRASDDPLASARIATLRTAEANDAAWGANVNLGRSLAAQADGLLQHASALTVRAQELGIAGGNPSLTAADRAAIAIELQAVAQELDSAAMQQSSLGQPLFADGAALAMRFDSATLFAPVPTRAALFESGGQTIADHVRSLAAAVADGNGATLDAARTRVDAAFDQLITGQAQLGLNAARLDRIADMLSERTITHRAERSTIEDTDLPSAIARLNAQTITLEAAQAAFARINRRTLFDILG